MTRLLSRPPRRLRRPPTSHVDSLVAFIQTPPASTTTNESLRLVGGLSTFSTAHAGSNDHQRVTSTRWWLLYRPHQLRQPPTSHDDSLVAFFLLHRPHQPQQPPPPQPRQPRTHFFYKHLFLSHSANGCTWIQTTTDVVWIGNLLTLSLSLTNHS